VRGLIVFLCVALFLVGLGVVTAVTRGYSPSEDELRPDVATITENGMPKVVTTGP
jgi:hypothetical protein